MTEGEELDSEGGELDEQGGGEESAAISLDAAALALDGGTRNVALAPGGGDDRSIRAVLTYTASLPSADSKRCVREVLNRIASILGVDGDAQRWRRVDWVALGPSETTLIQAAMVQKYAPAVVRQSMSLLRGVLKAGWRLGFIDGDRYQRSIDTSAIKGESLEAGRALTEEEIAQLKGYVQRELPGAYGLMVACAFAIGLYLGLRRKELAALQVDSVRDERDQAVAEQTSGAPPKGYRLKVYGKGAKWRTQPIPKDIGEMLVEWIKCRAELGVTHDGLFVQLARTGQLVDAPVSRESIARLITQIGRDAGLAHFTCHDLRRTFATGLFEGEKVDGSTIQALMGHRSFDTTVRYDKRGEKKKDKGAKFYEGRWGLPPEDIRVDTTAAGAGAEDQAPPPPVMSPAVKVDGGEAIRWLREQCRALRDAGFGVEQIAKALDKKGVRSRGKWLTTRDVEAILRF